MGKKTGRHVINRFDKLHDRLSNYRNGWIFRGHSDVSWKLVPKAGRIPYLGQEKSLFEKWKRRAIEYLHILPESDWDWLAIAQHHGLATRLLDWTTNPLNAAFFAIRERLDADAVIFAARIDPLVIVPAERTPDPLLSNGVTIYHPKGLVPRITRQGGLFTVHGPPEIPLDQFPGVTLDRIVIDKTYRTKLLTELAYYGVSSASLFPDLDGLSEFLNWEVT